MSAASEQAMGHAADAARRNERRAAGVACGAHALHDGLTDTLYLLLPLWQAEFGLGYAAVGMLRALYTGAMAGLQVPAARVAQRVGGARMLTAGTAVAAAAYLCFGASSSFAMLAAALLLGGIGSSTQHPIASSLVAAAYEGPRSRGALGTYNFAGDLGKMVLPSITESTAFVLFVAKENRKGFLVVRLQRGTLRHYRLTLLDGWASLDSFIPSLEIREIFQILSLQLVQSEPRIGGDVGY